MTVRKTCRIIGEFLFMPYLDKRYTCVLGACMPAAGAATVYYRTWTALQHHIRTVHPPTCTHSTCNGKTFSSQKGLRAHQKLHETRDLEIELETTEEPPRKRRRGGELGRDWVCDIDQCEKDFKSASTNRCIRQTYTDF